MPLDPLSRVLLPLFLPSELSSSSVFAVDLLELSDDKHLSCLVLIFGRLECCGLPTRLFFFNFFFKSRTCCCSASTVSSLYSSQVRSLVELPALGSSVSLALLFILEGSRYRWDGSGFCSLLTSDLMTILRPQSAFSEGEPSGHLLSLLEERSVSIRGFSSSGIIVSFPRSEYPVTFSIRLVIFFGILYLSKYFPQTAPIVVGKFLCYN